MDRLKINFQTGEVQSVGVWGNEYLPDEYSHVVHSGPDFMDDKVMVFVSATCNPKMQYRVYRWDQVEPGKLLAYGSELCTDALFFEPIARSGVTVYFSWAGYCSGPAVEGLPPRCPLFLSVPLAKGMSPGSYSAPFHVTDAVHVLTAHGGPDGPHVFVVDNQFNISWIH